VFTRQTSNWYRCVVLWSVLFLWESVIREDIVVAWGNRWRFVISDEMYGFMNILLKVFYQEETVHSLLSEQNWQEILQSKTILLSIVYLFFTLTHIWRSPWNNTNMKPISYMLVFIGHVTVVIYKKLLTVYFLIFN